MFSERDLAQMHTKGISPANASKQIKCFETGFPFVELDRPATAGDGIIRLDQEQISHFLSLYERRVRLKKLMKFVPASGAATRMFKDLYNWRNSLREGIDSNELLNTDADAFAFFTRLTDFAFWDDLAQVMCREDLLAEHLLNEKNFLPLLNFLIDDVGLDYGFLPKGLIKFHRYDVESRTASDEHLAEGALYACDSGGEVRIHFTVSDDHLGHFEERMKKIKVLFEQQYTVRYEISFSVQKSSTDTIAVDSSNKPFRERDGSILFRPGGHGALIENLNDLDADLVFIKNIDNVVPDHLKHDTVLWKKVLTGMLVEVQSGLHHWLALIDHGTLSDNDYADAIDFAKHHLMIDTGLLPKDSKTGTAFLGAIFDRPIRVCGMVKNEGEPGGGPFWVRSQDNEKLSLQVVEASQINLSDPGQNSIMEAATHFNPVDMVCALKDREGRKYKLPDYIDHQTGFISIKSKDGRELKALELPGLWNGSMAKWNTIFVEVPLITFNPVKVVNDLLRKEHQPL